jgi:hypothetical protein
MVACVPIAHIRQMEPFRPAKPLPRGRRAQVGEHRGDAPIPGTLVAQVELDEDLPDVGLDGRSRDGGRADRLVGEASAISPRTARSRSESCARARRRRLATRRSTIAVDTQPPLATLRTASSSVSISPTRSLSR